MTNLHVLALSPGTTVRFQTGIGVSFDTTSAAPYPIAGAMTGAGKLTSIPENARINLSR
jgi:hypothetical protein